MSTSKRPSEWHLEKRLLRAMSPVWIAHKHTDAAAGVPDLSYTLRRPRQGTGWIELKTARRPASPDTPIKLELSAPQRLWLSRRAREGCPCWVVLGLGPRPYKVHLFSWSVAQELVANKYTPAALNYAAAVTVLYSDLTIPSCHPAGIPHPAARRFADALEGGAATQLTDGELQ